MHEIEFTYEGKTSWMYFHPKKDPKEEGTKHFKRVCRDSGWTKGAKLIKIRKVPKAVDPPLTKAQKDALRKEKRAKPSNNSRRPRGDRKSGTKSRKVSGDVPSTSLSRILETGPPRAKVSKKKLPKTR